MKQSHNYNPFKHSVLGFFSLVDQFGNNTSENIINDIHLYQQPVEKPSIALIFFVVRCLLAFIAEFCNYRILLMLKKDESAFRDVTRLHTYTIMLLLPIRLIFYTLTDIIHPLNKIMGQWVCTSFWIFNKIAIQIILSHSLFVAIIRYNFIVNNEKLIEFGKEKFQRLMWYLYIGIPIFTLLWVATDLEDIDTVIQINRCNGKDHKMFLIKSWSSSGLILNNFKLPYNEMNSFAEKFVSVVRKSSKIIQRIWQLLLSSNIGEAIIYFILIKHMRRTHNESMVKLKKLLSDDQKIIRHRRLVLGIQITITTWLVELIAYVFAIFVLFIGLNPQHRVGEICVGELIVVLYAIILPGIVLIRDSELKDNILESSWYISILNTFGWIYKGPMRENVPGVETPSNNDEISTNRETANLEMTSNRKEKKETSEGTSISVDNNKSEASELPSQRQ